MTLTPASLPALACARAAPTAAGFEPAATEPALAALRALVPAWCVGSGSATSAGSAGKRPHLAVEEEAEAAARVVRFALDRLHRLTAAYGEWSDFDVGAYFDLTAAQTALLVQVVEQQGEVHVRLHADLLLPRVQRALRSWAELEQLQSAGAQAAAGSAHAGFYADAWADARMMRAAARLAHDWLGAIAVVSATRRLLAGEVSYMAANAADEERRIWQLPFAAGHPTLAGAAPRRSGHESGTPPTLTLATSFPLPAWRQPGRRRRLVRARAARLARLARLRRLNRPPLRRPRA